jgi:Imm-5 like putative immunity protein
MSPEQVLRLFERDSGTIRGRSRRFNTSRAWIRGGVYIEDARRAAFAANAAARGLGGPAKFARPLAGQAAAVAHVTAHDLGAAAYAIRAAHPPARAGVASAAGLNPSGLAQRELRHPARRGDW